MILNINDIRDVMYSWQCKPFRPWKVFFFIGLRVFFQYTSVANLSTVSYGHSVPGHWELGKYFWIPKLVDASLCTNPHPLHHQSRLHVSSFNCSSIKGVHSNRKYSKILGHITLLTVPTAVSPCLIRLQLYNPFTEHSCELTEAQVNKAFQHLDLFADPKLSLHKGKESFEIVQTLIFYINSITVCQVPKASF